jgi:hypothetical protein
MPRVGLEHTIPASKRAKTVHGLDHSAIATGLLYIDLLTFLVRPGLLCSRVLPSTRIMYAVQVSSVIKIMLSDKRLVGY